jgi:adenylate cyclase
LRAAILAGECLRGRAHNSYFARRFLLLLDSRVQCPTCGSEVPPGFKFCGQCGTKLETAPVVEAKVEAKADPGGAQRREVAVLFADVSGFTAMSEKLDAEDVHELMNRCFAGIGAAIQEEGGYIDKYIGDNVMALFGAPVAHEDDPARACRAALGIQNFIGEFSAQCERESGLRLQMRIGVTYGLVLAGGVGSDVKMDYTVMGDTVNLASRLEGAAAPGTVLVSEEIQRHAQHDFEFGPPLDLKVKGKEKLVRAYTLLREATSVRFVAPAAAPFVSRDREMAQLRERIERHHHGRQWVEIRGEIGIGKSRLVREIFTRLAGRHLVHVVATPAICRRPFGLVRRLITASLAEFRGEKIETAQQFAASLHALSPRLDIYEKALWYVTAPSRMAVSAPEEDPLSFRRTIERGVFVFLRALITRHPDAVFFLDAFEHVDEASALLLRGREEGAWPLPIITATRPREGVATGAPGEEPAIMLGPLEEHAAAELLAQLTHHAPVPDGFRRNILRRAAGVPLFLEEIVRALIEAGELAATPEGNWAFKPSPQAAKLPSSLRSAMVTRLDRLQQSERELLGHCSVQGVEFNIAVTERVREMRGFTETSPIFENLVRFGMVRRIPEAVLPTGAFVQPLMQEACYQMLLRRERRELHEITARALCELAGGAENVAPEALVFHYENAEQWENAAMANLRAANRAAEIFLNDDALAGYERVAANLEKAGGTSESMRRLRLLAALGAAEVRVRTGAYACAEERVQTFLSLATSDAERAEGWRILAAVRMHTGHAEEAQRLLLESVVHGRSDDFPNPDVLSLSWYGLAELHHRAGRMEEALDALRRCRETAPETRTRTRLRADLLEGVIAHTRGHFAEAAGFYRRAFALACNIGNVVERARAINQLGNVARDEGDYGAAQNAYREALRLWLRIGDTECIAGGQNNLGNLALSRGHFTAARVHYEESLAASTKIGNVHGVALAHANLGMLALEEGDGLSAIDAARASLEALSGSANDILRGLVENVLAEGHLLAGAVDQAEQCFQKVLGEFSASTHPLALATALRGCGRVATARGAWDEARALFARAIAAFEQLKRTQEKARTMLDEARLERLQNNCAAARARATTALERFTAIRAELDAERARRFLADFE